MQCRKNLGTKTDVFLSVLLVQCGRSKTLNKDNVDAKLFMRFHETENGGFRKRVIVVRALVSDYIQF